MSFIVPASSYRDWSDGHVVRPWPRMSHIKRRLCDDRAEICGFHIWEVEL